MGLASGLQLEATIFFAITVWGHVNYFPRVPVSQTAIFCMLCVYIAYIAYMLAAAPAVQSCRQWRWMWCRRVPLPVVGAFAWCADLNLSLIAIDMVGRQVVPLAAAHSAACGKVYI